MQLKVISALAFVTLVAADLAPPVPGHPLPTVPASQCGAGQLQCCRLGQAPSGSEASAALSRLGISKDSVRGLVGLNCDRNNANSCTATPLCCTDNSHGDIAVACNPVKLNS